MKLTSRYTTIKSSQQTDTQGNEYPDIMTLPIKNFKFTSQPLDVVLSQNDLIRFDALCYKVYGVAYYEDIVLWLNKIIDFHELQPGDILSFPSKRDIEKYIIRNAK